MDKAEVRFWKFVGPTDANGCWPWIGILNFGGYGQFWYDNKQGMAHKYSYRLHHGHIDESLTIDHLCRNRRCVNPTHLEQVSMRENRLRGESPTAINYRKTHCPKGHEYTPENTCVVAGKRHCRTCQREW